MEEFKHPGYVKSPLYLKRKANQDSPPTLKQLYYGTPPISSSPFHMNPQGIGKKHIDNIGYPFALPTSHPGPTYPGSPPFNDKESPVFSSPESHCSGRQLQQIPLVYQMNSCRICNNNVNPNEQPILCAGCNFWFHRICTGLEETAFYLLTKEKNAKWVCDDCFSIQKQSEITNEMLIGEMEELLAQIQ